MSFGASSQAATPLQAARLELGWKQTQTIRALQQAAADEGVSIASDRSLKTMLSRWENGHDTPDHVGQRLLCKVYGQSVEELGFLSANPEGLIVPRMSTNVGPEMVHYFRNVLAEHLRADNLMGPHHLVDVVRAQTTLLDQMLPGARGEVRRELLTMAFRYNEFAGWLYQDAGNSIAAMRFTDRAMEFAMELNQPRETAYVLMRKADIAADLDNPLRAVGLAEAAMRSAATVDPRLRALIFRVSGRAHARRGDAGECARAMEAAYTEVVQPGSGPDGLTDYCTPAYIGMETATSWSHLGRFDNAVDIYEQSLDTWPGPLRRDQGLCLARLASAHAGRGDTDAACLVGRRAVEVVHSAPSGRAMSELQRVRVRLAPHRRNAEVSDLSDRIRGLMHPAA